MNRRVKVCVYEDVGGCGDKFAEAPTHERWLLGSRAERVLALLDGDLDAPVSEGQRHLGDEIARLTASATERNEQLMLAELRIKELDDRVRKLEFENAELDESRAKATKEAHWAGLCIEWFVRATNLPTWMKVVAKAMEHEERGGGGEDE
jgi:hypothetical protein